jgi:hypothetical protein
MKSTVHIYSSDSSAMAALKLSSISPNCDMGAENGCA